jgi:hypothetical protein
MQQVATAVMPAQFIEQALIISIFQPAVGQLIGDFRLQGFHFDLKVRQLAVPVRVPDCLHVLQQLSELCPEVAGAAVFSRQYVIHRAQNVGEPFLLADPIRCTASLAVAGVQQLSVIYEVDRLLIPE